MPSHGASILIVGAGVFGLSLALELSHRGYKNITVLDRSLPPVEDGSSVDISRVIRSEYGDVQYNVMAIEALDAWRTDTWKQHYHESGFCILSDGEGHSYLEKAKALSLSQSSSIIDLENGKKIKQQYPYLHGSMDDLAGYTNPRGGWAASVDAIRTLASRCAQRGVSFITGGRGTAVSLIIREDRVRGVNVLNGPPILCDTTVLATGAWTNQLLDISQSAVSTAHPVGFIQLTANEVSQFADMPIILNLSTGFFAFPPTPDTHILKFARHGYGYENEISISTASGPARKNSSPLRDSNNAKSGFIPQDAEECFRRGLRLMFPPSISERPFSKTRMCWYTDTPVGDWIVDYHSELGGVFLVTGGSGHAFKFLPILGKYTADVFEDKASSELRQKWAFKPGDEKLLMHGDGSRGGPPRRKLLAWEQAKL